MGILMRSQRRKSAKKTVIEDFYFASLRLCERLLLFSLAICAAAAPQRIVSLSPNVTELLYGVGAFPQVVGVSDYCTYPPEVKKLPTVGGWHDPSLEKLAVMRPDLVIVDDAQAPFVQDSFRKLGLRLMVLPTHHVEDVYRAMAELGKATGHDTQAAQLIAATRQVRARVSQKTAALSHPGVVMIVDRTPGTLRELITATTGGFLSELVEMAGGRIAVAPAKDGYGKLSKEDLLAANPDVILDFVHGSDSRFAGNLMEAWREMPELKAVRSGRVYRVNEDYVPHASQRMVQTAELFARLIHPEAK
jgi:ABC-type Fe3+-hydroxamate transport system substrate-binding protein